MIDVAQAPGRVHQDDQVEVAEVACCAQQDLLGLVHGQAVNPDLIGAAIASHEPRADQPGSPRSALAPVHRREHRYRAREPRQPPPEQPGGGDMGEHRVLGEHQAPGMEVPQELLLFAQLGTFEEEQPVAEASKPRAAYLTSNRFIVIRHAAMMGSERAARSLQRVACG
jgi:hypothetical protein